MKPHSKRVKKSKATLETSGEDHETTLQTGEKIKSYTRNEWRRCQVHFIVPRRATEFQEDLLPDCPSGEASVTAEKWLCSRTEKM